MADKVLSAEYLKHRDDYMQTEIYAEFVQDFREGRVISDSEFIERLKKAFERASEDFIKAATPDT